MTANATELRWLTPNYGWDGGGEAPIGMMAGAAGALAVLVPCALACLLGSPHSRRPRWLQSVRHRVALVIAHPDDEAMFFWPTLLQLRDAGVPLSILCLSTGNADGLGKVRTAEMQRSCARVNVTGRGMAVLDVGELQDGFHSWPEEVVARHVQAFVKEQQADVILTFDDRGVSGHPNHISTSLGVRRASDTMGANSGTARPTVLMLESVSLMRKYIGLFSVWVSLNMVNEVSTSTACICYNPLVCLQALTTHWSQLVWYRVLFTLFSHYAYVNSFVQHQHAHPKGGRGQGCQD